jgi:hypothetical protein
MEFVIHFHFNFDWDQEMWRKKLSYILVKCRYKERKLRNAFGTPKTRSSDWPVSGVMVLKRLREE